MSVSHSTPEPTRRQPCIDFHFHSVYSNDAFGVPAEYIALAAKQQVVAIAPTEHDNTDSLAKYVAAAQAIRAPLQIFSGVEIDTYHERWGHFHLLAFFFDPGHAGLQAILHREVAAGMKRLEAVAAQMRKAGERVDLEAAYALYRSALPDRAVGPKSLWKWLEHTGRAESFDAAKELYNRFADQVPVTHRSAALETVIAQVHAADGITVLAHPCNDYTEADIQDLFAMGLDGIEVFHMKDVALMKQWLAAAQRHGWPMSGGSDNHQPVSADHCPWPTYASAELLPGLLAAAKKRHGKLPKPAFAPVGLKD